MLRSGASARESDMVLMEVKFAGDAVGKRPWGYMGVWEANEPRIGRPLTVDGYAPLFWGFLKSLLQNRLAVWLLQGGLLSVKCAVLLPAISASRRARCVLSGRYVVDVGWRTCTKRAATR